MDKVTRQCPQTTTFLKRKESRSAIEPRSRLTARPNRLTGRKATGLQSYIVQGLAVGHSWSILNTILGHKYN